MLALHYFFTVTLRERFQDKERGATAVEYGLLVALIAAVIVTIVMTLGGQINAAFTKVSGEIGKVVP